MSGQICIGLLESISISGGIQAADVMLKAALVRPLFARAVCPGKYLTAVAGDVAAVQASMEAGREDLGRFLADWTVIPNLHPDIAPALSGMAEMPEPNALGIIETYTAASLILAADAALKAANVSLVDIRMATGLGGKAYAVFTGDVGAVSAAVEAGTLPAAENGLLVNRTVIAQPMPELWNMLA